MDYRIFWLDHQHRNRCIALKALTEIMCQAHFQDHHGTLQTKDYGYPWPKGFFLVHADKDAMTNFTAKRLAQGTSQRSKLVYREKRISRPLG